MKQLIGVDLKRFLRDYRRRCQPERELAILLQSVEYPANVGSIFRLADGAGVSEMILAGITPTPPHPTIEKIGRAKSKNVNWRYEKDPLEAANSLKNEGYQLVALELVEEAIPYHLYTYPDRTCLVVGHEDHGLTKALLNLCDSAVFIPMYGKGRSHNVHAALAIVLYHALHSEIP
jgi:tRNA (guanosine-2'-O-)-methyltransferase